MLLTLLSFAGPTLAKGSPIKSPKTLARALKKAEKKLLKKHLALAKKLKKEKRLWYRYRELLAAQRLDPANRSVKRKIPDPPPFPPKQEYKEYAQRRKPIVELAKRQLGALLERAAKGALNIAAVGPVARRLLQYDPDHAGARSAMGFRGKQGRWLTQREQAIQQAYAEAWKKAPQGKPVQGRKFPNLEKAMGFELMLLEGPHALAGGPRKSANPANLRTVLQSAEVAYAAFHQDFFGVEGIYRAPGSTRKATGGPKLKNFGKPLFLVLENKEQHLRYLDRVVTNKKTKKVGKTLNYVITGFKPDKVLIIDGYPQGALSKEWPARRMTLINTLRRFGQNRPLSLRLGIERWYSARVSGNARIRAVPTGSAVRGGKKFQRVGDYFQLRNLARMARDNFLVDPPVAKGMRKRIEGMRRPDDAVATAFVDFLFATAHDKLIALFTKGDLNKTPLDDLLKTVFGGQTPEQLDQKFGAWFDNNY